MTWNIVSECVSMVILCIIWVYARKGNPLPSLRNRMFQLCFLVTFCGIFSNVVSTLLIYNFTSVPLSLTWTVTTIYFIVTPLMGAIYFFYSASVLCKSEKQIFICTVGAIVPAAIYLLFALTNGYTKLLFDINITTGYIRGSFTVVTYIIFYIYCLMCVVLTIINFADLSETGKRILAVFPILAILVVIIQQMFPEQMLSGSAATCALLIIYLYMENKQISIDYLTNLPNRQVFLEMLGLKIHKRNTDNFLVIVFSIKGFKQLNNKLGQNNGNLYLQQIAHFLKQKTSQYLLYRYSLYRYSGDEFAILCEDYTQKNINNLIHDFNERMNFPWTIGNYSTIISAAIGIIRYQNDMNSVEKIINGIEYAVTQAKCDSTQDCVYFSSEMLKAAARKDEIISILKDRLTNDSLELYYQPIYGVSENSFIIAESLSRLTSTPLGNISPDEFISIAEDTGLIIPMTYQILDKVCKFIRRLLDKDVSFTGISINISAVQFSDITFSKKFCDIIENNNVPYDMVKIEITESVLVDNFHLVKIFMSEMHEKGVLFGLDDFGTGYSNLSSVLQLPWDTVKLDKSLVYTAVENESAGILVCHIIEAFAALGLRILAEGVENDIQKNFVIENGCAMIQGFLYAKPCPPDDAERIFCNQLHVDTIV